jgi:hypothetical protein
LGSSRIIHPARGRGRNVGRPGYRRCGQLTAGCGYWLPVGQFYTNGVYGAAGLSRRCKRCLRMANRLRQYRLTRDAYKAMLADQGGCCARCKTPLRKDGAGSNIDHDWECCPRGSRTCGQCVRGILCPTCNGLLSRAWCASHPSDPYLRRYQARRSHETRTTRRAA